MVKKYNVKGFAFIGRTFDEYQKMFDLNEDELKNNTFLDCPSETCSFVSEAHQKGIPATACDIEYDKSFDHFQKQCDEEIEKIKLGFSGAEDLFDWSFYINLDRLLTYRKKAAMLFLEDYKKRADYYVQRKLPILGFSDNQFDIVLSGHFLFLYADRLDFNFHLASILELIRVAKKEVRIYPLIALDGSSYTQMEQLLDTISAQGYQSRIKNIDFKFLKGSSQMLSIRKIAR